MLGDLLFSFNIIMPMVLMMVLGQILKIKNILKPVTIDDLSYVCYHYILPINIFKSLYGSTIDVFPKKLIIYSIICVFLEFFLGIIISRNKPTKKRGSIIQSLVRGNYIYIGLPLTAQIFTDPVLAEKTSLLVSLVGLFIIPIFNTLPIFGFSMGEENASPKKLIKSLVTNPILIGVFAGLIVILFRLIFPSSNGFLKNKLSFIYKVIEYISQCGTPVALIVIGAQLSFNEFSDYKDLISTTLIRVLLQPVVILSIGAFLLKFDGPSMAVLFAAFASPVGVTSAIVAKEMGGDEILATNIVALTTVASGVTLFLFLFFFKTMGVL